MRSEEEIKIELEFQKKETEWLVSCLEERKARINILKWVLDNEDDAKRI